MIATSRREELLASREAAERGAGVQISVTRAPHPSFRHPFVKRILALVRSRGYLPRLHASPPTRLLTPPTPPRRRTPRPLREALRRPLVHPVPGPSPPKPLGSPASAASRVSVHVPLRSLPEQPRRPSPRRLPSAPARPSPAPPRAACSGPRRPTAEPGSPPRSPPTRVARALRAVHEGEVERARARDRIALERSGLVRVVQHAHLARPTVLRHDPSVVPPPEKVQRLVVVVVRRRKSSSLSFEGSSVRRRDDAAHGPRDPSPALVANLEAHPRGRARRDEGLPVGDLGLHAREEEPLEADVIALHVSVATRVFETVSELIFSSATFVSETSTFVSETSRARTAAAAANSG